MTEKVNPSPFRPAEAFKTAGSIANAGGSGAGYIVSPSNPSEIGTQDSSIDETQFTGFGQQSSSSSFDVTIEPGEAFIYGSWLAIDTNTTVTLNASTTSTIYVGWDKDASNEVLLGTDSAFSGTTGNTDQKVPLYDVTTDGSGVTSVTDRRLIGRVLRGSHLAPDTTQAANYTTSGEQIIFVDSTGGAVTITLSDADTVAGNEVSIIDSGGVSLNNTITVETESTQQIDGSTSIVIDTDYGATKLASDGANWYSSGGGGSAVPVIDSTTATLTGGASPALDATYTTTHTDPTTALDVIVSPSNTPSFAYEYNYDVSVGYDGSNVTIGVTVNWDDDPGSGNDITADIEIFNRE